jgi:hypothetical protein
MNGSGHLDEDFAQARPSPRDKSDCHFRKQRLNMRGTWYKVVELHCEVTIGYNPILFSAGNAAAPLFHRTPHTAAMRLT